MVLPLIPVGSKVLDGGANIGAFTVPLAKKVGPLGQVYAYEAQRVLSQILNTNIVLNQLTNVHIANEALGAHSGSISVPIVSTVAHK